MAERKRQRGIALITALLVLAIATIAAVEIANRQHLDIRRTQNTLARDSYTFIHLPIVLGIVFMAMGIEESILHLDEHLHTVPAFALAGGFAIYLLAHVAFRLRNVGSVSWRRLVTALVALGIVSALAVGLITYEVVRFADARDRVRHELQRDAAAG